MNLKECNHAPHVSRITFDVGQDQIAVYELCKNCKELSIFLNNVLNKEEIEK